MPQATQHWLPSHRVHVVYNAADEQLVQIQGSHSIATCPWRAEERNDIAFEHYDPSSSDLTGFDFQSQFPFSGHESPQAGNFPWPWFIPPNGAADLPTSWLITDSSPQSPVGPSAAGHLSSQDLTDINHQGLFQFPFGGNGHSQPGNGQVLLSSPSGAAGSTSWTMIDSSPQSPVGFSATGYHSNQESTDINSGLSQFPFGGNEHSQPGNSPWPSSIPPSGAVGSTTSSTTITVPSARSPVGPSVTGPHVTTEDGLRTVGSPQVQKAAARRRTKDGIYQCPFGNCNATFTELHNLHYHKNSHLGLKPYKCSTCKFAAASPATVKRHMKRHQSSCKDTGHTIEGTCEPKSSWTL